MKVKVYFERDSPEIRSRVLDHVNKQVSATATVTQKDIDPDEYIDPDKYGNEVHNENAWFPEQYMNEYWEWRTGPYKLMNWTNVTGEGRNKKIE